MVDKPAGFHTHPPEDPKIRLNPHRNALGILERQLGTALAPAHRLDRAASGLLVYARMPEARAMLQKQFASGEAEKRYYILVRGEPRSPCIFELPLESEAGGEQAAKTTAEACFTFELPIPHPRGGHRRFTVLETKIHTGRFHQIRRHFAQAGFPLIGDTRHGDRKLNREFAERTGCSNLFLRCMFLEFRCPSSGGKISIRTRWSRDWHRLFERAGACALTSPPFREPPSLS